MKYSIPDEVKYIINTLNKNGYRADVVGGAVRDMYLGRPLSDFDITTNALPETVKQIFSGLHTIDIGLKHGTVTLRLCGSGYEVTTWRRDGDYLDSRHPESVEFTGELSEDVLRRDFTMNALCYNDADGITDLVGGREDIDRRIIRTVGEPRVRFSEDALRILRALRFAAVLGFSIEEMTAEAIHSLAGTLRGISRERIYSEWMKLISGDYAYSVINEFSDVISVFLPNISLKLPKEENFRRQNGFVRVLSIFALGSEDPPLDFESCMYSLKTSRAEREVGKAALELLLSGLPKNITEMLLVLSRVDTETARLAFRTGAALEICSDDAEELVSRALATGIPYRIRDLALDGNDLKMCGITGESIGKALDMLLMLVIKGECKNEREELLRHI